MFLEKVLATFCRSGKFKRSHKFIQSFEFIRSTKGCLNLFQKRDLHLKKIEDFQNIAKTIGLHSELLSRYFLCQIFEPLLPLSIFWAVTSFVKFLSFFNNRSKWRFDTGILIYRSMRGDAAKNQLFTKQKHIRRGKTR